MTKLSVNLNKVALLRNTRVIGIPSVVEAAQTCVQAGAHGGAVHPRPDERHTKADIERAKEVGADRIELYTESYAAAYGSEIVFERYAVAAKKAQEVGLGVNAGHDLNLKNLGKFCSIPDILEVSVGHALIADALWIGLFNAVQAYLKVLSECNPLAAPGK